MTADSALYGVPVPEVDVNFFFFFRHMEFLGQGSDLSHSCGHTGSATHCAGLGIKSEPQSSQDAADPITPQWELPDFHLSVLCVSVRCIGA